MRSFSSSFACAQRRSIRPPQDEIAWARDLVARPQRYGADERTRGIVRDLLAEATR